MLTTSQNSALLKQVEDLRNQLKAASDERDQLRQRLAEAEEQAKSARGPAVPNPNAVARAPADSLNAQETGVAAIAKGADSTWARPIVYSAEIVTRVQESPAVQTPGYRDPAVAKGRKIEAIVLHNASAADSGELVARLRYGTDGAKGPRAHWLVESNGGISTIAPETDPVTHLIMAGATFKSANTIAVQTSGQPAFADDKQIETLVRLVSQIADRWGVPSERILSGGEVEEVNAKERRASLLSSLLVTATRRSEMKQQAPVIRQMVDAVRNKK